MAAPYIAAVFRKSLRCMRVFAESEFCPDLVSFEMTGSTCVAVNSLTARTFVAR
jgi:hypothetical protein